MKIFRRQFSGVGFAGLVMALCLATAQDNTGAAETEQAADTKQAEADVTKQRLAELDAYWEKVSKAVGSGDFDSYRSTCHHEGVLVSGSRKMSQPLADALARWKKEFDATKAGDMKASVEFRFAERFGDATTAHETGMFCYANDSSGKMKKEFIHFEALLVKRDGDWKILMEYQKSVGTEEEWRALAKP